MKKRENTKEVMIFVLFISIMMILVCGTFIFKDTIYTEDNDVALFEQWSGGHVSTPTRPPYYRDYTPEPEPTEVPVVHATATPTPTPTPTATPTPAPVFRCYADKSTLETATTATWKNEKNATVSDHLISGVTEKTCVPLKKPNTCTPNRIPPSKITKATSKCEDGFTIEYNDGYNCNGNSFYEIKCKNILKVKYDHDNDNVIGNLVRSVKKMLVGEGVAFGIDIELVRECDATFNSGNWQEAYNSVNNRIAKIEENIRSASSTEINTLNRYRSLLINSRDEINGLKTSYTNLRTALDPEFDPVITFELLNYKVANSNRELKTNLISLDSAANKGSGTFSNETNSGVSGVKNYHWTNSSNPLKLKFVFPKTYLTPALGNAKLTIERGEIARDGGNKIYIDNDTNSSTSGTEYVMKFVLDSDPVKITNDKCKIRVFKSEIKYRPISLSNPFINSEYEKGDNWVNTLYDFTKTIDVDTWSKRYLYDVSMSYNKMTELRNSNYSKSAIFPYLGLCNRDNSKDSITSEICECIRRNGSSCTIR